MFRSLASRAAPAFSTSVTRRKPGSTRSASIRPCRSVLPVTGCNRGLPCKAISIRYRSSLAGKRWNRPSSSSALPWAAGLSSSTSGMGSCRRPRRRMSPPWRACWPSRSPPPDMARHAVVLMNLGGPDSPAAVRPFLYNLFSDPAIIGLPAPLRLPLAWLIALRRSAVAGEIYAHLGGASPLLPNTEAQAQALEAALDPDYRCFIAMRYWHPLTAAAVAAVAVWRPDNVVLLPLYPQFSTTTTGSSLAAWRHEATRQGLDRPTLIVSN